MTLDRARAASEAADRGLFVGWHGEYRIDVFIPSIPSYAEALARRRRVRLAGRDTWVLSPEVLAVFKMLFFRAKDLRDLERLLAVQGDGFDRTFVRRHLVEMLGTEAEQVVPRGIASREVRETLRNDDAPALANEVALDRHFFATARRRLTLRAPSNYRPPHAEPKAPPPGIYASSSSAAPSAMR